MNWALYGIRSTQSTCMYVCIQWLVQLCACTKLMVACEQVSCGVDDNFSSFAYVEENTTIKTNKSGLYRAFSLTRPASMLIYWRKRKCLHKERIYLPKDFVDTPTGLRFIVLKHQHGRRTSCKNAQNFKCTETRLRQADLQSWTLRSHHYHLI